MRKSVKEIENVLHNHGYSIDTIILDVMKTFKFKTICRKVGFQKQDGYSASEIVTLMLMLPLMLLKSVNAFYKSGFQQVSAMKKDSLYRLKNNERMPWRTLLLAVAKQFQRLVNPEKEIATHSAFILDDTMEAKTGRRIEQISMVHDHVSGKQGSKLGFKNQTLGLFDGKSFNPLDFSLHAEKRLKKARHRREQYRKQRAPQSSGAKRVRECHTDKITNGLNMLKRASKQGFRANYILVDSWFSSKEFIQTAREIGKKPMHIICGVRKDKRNYIYQGNTLNAKKILSTLKSECKEKRCRKRNTRYFEVLVITKGLEKSNCIFAVFPTKKNGGYFSRPIQPSGF